MNDTVVVAGHVCLDIFPDLPVQPDHVWQLVPGMLRQVGPARLAPGGVVANTGLALHRLGLRPRLVGAVGRDLFGQAVLEAFQAHDSALTEYMLVREDAATAYAVVLSPPGMDRMFLAHTGANDTFSPDDLTDAHLAGARMLHVGYPPLLRRTYVDGGTALRDCFRRAKRLGLVTSLDMSLPDPASESGQVEWVAWLATVLPETDVFLPSLEELVFMLDRPRWLAGGDLLNDGTVPRMAARLLDMGVGTIVVKLGAQGLYAQTAVRAIHAPCFRVAVQGTTGAGDCTVAGFLAGIIHGYTLDECATLAVGAGACCVEAVDAFSGLIDLEILQRRISAGWERHPVNINMEERR
ncbi:MAG: PfkB family carbohydrate kinase [bacterium]